MNWNRLAGWSLAICLVTFGSVCGQDNDADFAFGKGVHAYYEGRWEDAWQHLNQAIDDETIDPRPYYFRGLIRNQLEAGNGGMEDIRHAAELEAAPRGQAFEVDTALERVQGPQRIELESIRQEVLSAGRLRFKRQGDGLADYQQRLAAAADADGGGGEAGVLDPADLPDVSALVDPTIPFPSTEAVVVPPNYVDPSDPVESLPIPGAADPMPPPQQPAQQTPPADDPFGGGGAGAEQPTPPPAEKKPDPVDDPFGGA